jgi:GT2 family glycosyltransferase
MAAPALVDGTFDLVCRGGAAWRAGSGCADGPAFSGSRTVFSIPWTAAVFRAELFARAGILEERFESYLEDVDFGLRCAGLGLSGRYVPEALAWHRGSATLGRWHPQTVRRISRNQLLLLARHYPRRLLLEAFWPILIAQLLWGALALRHGKSVAWLHGKMQGLQIFSECRGNAGTSSSDLMQHLREDEAGIREFQRSVGSDLYWKLYFFFTGAGSK